MTDHLSQKLSNIISGHRINQDDADWLRGLLTRQITPAARWRHDGEPDPHGDRYNCERGALALGDLTDEQLANGAYMNYDRPLNIDAVMRRDPNYHPPIVWMNAVKDRIRWLSRKLVEAVQPAPAVPGEVVAWRRKRDTGYARIWFDGAPSARECEVCGDDMVVAYAAPSAPAEPQGWREFIAECSKKAGYMVNGNQLSERAIGLLAAASESAGK